MIIREGVETGKYSGKPMELSEKRVAMSYRKEYDNLMDYLVTALSLEEYKIESV